MQGKSMNKTILTTALFFGATPAMAAPAAITGNWVTQEKDAIVNIAPCGATLCGTIAKYLVTPPGGVGQKDIHNPDAKLRGRTLLGMAVLTGFSADRTQWKGRIYDPKSGKSYRSVVYKGVSGKLIVKGCIGPFCQTQNWTPSK